MRRFDSISTGNRRQDTFFCADDCHYYIETMSEWCKKFNVEIWAYCLMPNHVHLIAVPATGEGLRRAIAWEIRGHHEPAPMYFHASILVGEIIPHG